MKIHLKHSIFLLFEKKILFVCFQPILALYTSTKISIFVKWAILGWEADKPPNTKNAGWKLLHDTFSNPNWNQVIEKKVMAFWTHPGTSIGAFFFRCSKSWDLVTTFYSGDYVRHLFPFFPHIIISVGHG